MFRKSHERGRVGFGSLRVLMLKEMMEQWRIALLSSNLMEMDDSKVPV